MFPSKQGISPFVPMLFSIFSFLLTFKCVQSCHVKHFLCGAGYWTQGPSTCWESVHLLNHSPSLLSILSHPLPPKSPVCCVLEMPATPPLLCLATMLSHSFAFPVTVPFKHPSISPCHYPSRLPSPDCLLPHADSHWVNLCFLVRTTSSTKSKPRPVFKFFLQLFLFPGASRYSPDTYKELICPWASTRVAYYCKDFFMMSNHSRIPTCSSHLFPVYHTEWEWRMQRAHNFLAAVWSKAATDGAFSSTSAVWLVRTVF